MTKENTWEKKGEELHKTFSFPNFIEAIGFVNKVALEAETMNHHPNIDIRYNKVHIVLTTHSEGKVTEKDMNLAERIDAKYQVSARRGDR